MAERWPFVGRDRELARAEESIAAGIGVLLVGEPGVGKSALAAELARRATTSGGLTVPVLGHVVSSGVPFEAFAGVLTEPPERNWVELGVAEVAALVSAVLTAGSGGGRARPLLVVDDVQLLDPRSAQVLLHLAARGTATVVATAPVTPGGMPLPAAVDRLWRDGLCERIELDVLPPGEIGALMEAALGAPVEQRAAAAFAERSGGNPLLLKEFVSSARETSLVRDSHGVWTLTGSPALTSGIRETVAARLAGLPGELRAALELVAAGEPIPRQVIGDLLADEVLDELADQRLLFVRDGFAGPVVSTAHPIHGEVLRTDMPVLRLHRLRLELARRLESAEQAVPHDLVRAAVWRLDSGAPADPDRMLAAARAARRISLATTERLARHVYETSGSLAAALLLAELYTHTGRGDEAVQLTAQLPPESLSRADRDAIVYCAAMSRGLQGDDPSGGAELVAGVLAGESESSLRLRGLQATLLAFDARFEAAEAVAAPLLTDPSVDPVTQSLAGMASAASAYWTGRFRRAVDLADRLAPLADASRAAIPVNPPSIELIAASALADSGDLDGAEHRGRQLARTIHTTQDDPFVAPRADYLLGRVALLRGQAATARHHLLRAAAGLSQFDRAIHSTIMSLAARAAAMAGDLDWAQQALRAVADEDSFKPFQLENRLAAAFVAAAALDLDAAAEQAAWTAGVGAARGQWSIAMTGYHDTARYGRPRPVLDALREAVAHVDGTLAWCYLDHAVALAAHDGTALTEVSRRFESHGALALAAEAASEAALAQAAAGHSRPARAASATAAALWARCDTRPVPWLTGAAVPVALTGRERQIAALAADHHTDAAIAARLGISVRTVHTHLANIYTKLGIRNRTELATHLSH